MQILFEIAIGFYSRTYKTLSFHQIFIPTDLWILWTLMGIKSTVKLFTEFVCYAPWHELVWLPMIVEHSKIIHYFWRWNKEICMKNFLQKLWHHSAIQDWIHGNLYIVGVSVILNKNSKMSESYTIYMSIVFNNH